MAVKLYAVKDQIYGEDAFKILRSLYNWGICASEFKDIELNYRPTRCRNLQSLLEYLARRPKLEICFLHILTSKNEELIIHSHRVEKNINTTSSLNGLIVSSSSLLKVDAEYIVENMKEVLSSYPWDYGYLYEQKANYDILTEKRVRIGFFSTSVKLTKQDISLYEKLKEIKEGYIPKLYLFNILNIAQQKNEMLVGITGVWYPLNENFSLFCPLG